MLLHYILTKEFRSIAATLGWQYLIVFWKLYFIVVDSLAQIVSYRIAIFNIMQLL